MSRFLRAVADGRLIGQRCSVCGKVYIPPRGSCPTDGVPTEEVVVLPNSSNVIMAADRAAELSEKTVAVVESRFESASRRRRLVEGLAPLATGFEFEGNHIDHVVSRMVRAGTMQAHNFEEYLGQVAEPVREAVKKNLYPVVDIAAVCNKMAGIVPA